MSGPLGREQLLELFEELSEELRFNRARAQIYVVGGAAMSLAFDRERTTRDVDARIAAGTPSAHGGGACGWAAARAAGYVVERAGDGVDASRGRYTRADAVREPVPDGDGRVGQASCWR